MHERNSKAEILIVGDGRESHPETEDALGKLPVTVLRAACGGEALSFVPGHKFAAVLLDGRRAEADGRDTVALMQESAAMRGTPIICVAAAGKGEGALPRARGIGAVDYVFRPVSADILRGKISIYLDLYHRRERIVRLNERLARSNEELERFAFICSHDLKSPLRAINNISQWLEEDLDPLMHGRSRDLMDELRKRVRRMEKLLDDTLEYSRAGSGQDDGPREIVSGRALVEDALALSPAPQGFTIRMAEGLERIRLCKLPVRQVLYNLINNAIKHHEGGNGIIDIDAQEREECFVFTVGDDGPGIAPEYHRKIFEMFQTLKPRDRREGSGMGLALVKKIVAARGGEIVVRSEPGKGAQFTFTWPKDAAEAGAGESPARHGKFV
jgi:signal transduction histidine kinase